MPRVPLGVIKKKCIICPSQEEALEAIAGWGDADRAAGIIDDSPSQPAYPEKSSQSSLERVFDVTGSSLCSGASQGAVEWVSTDHSSERTASNAALREEDSYNEAFESDRSQSLSRTLSWSLAAAHGGCSKDPKSPISATAVAEETEKSPLNLNLMKEVELSNRPSVPPEAGVPTGLRTELPLDKEATAEGDAEDRSGRREGSAIHKDDVGGATQDTTDVEARPLVTRSSGVHVESTRGSSLTGDSPALKPSSLGDGFGSASASDVTSLRRNQKDLQPPFLGQHPSAFAFQRDASVRSDAKDVLDSLDQMANSVQVNMQALDNMVVEEFFQKEAKSKDSCERRRCRVQHELDGLEKVGERGGSVETDPTLSTAIRDELENASSTVHHQGGHPVEISNGKEKSKEPFLSPTSSKILMDIAKMQTVDKAGATIASEDAGQHCPPSPPRPPRAVQEKLDKLRSQRANSPAHSGSVDLLRNRLRKERDNISAGSVLEAVKFRSGESSAAEVTAAGLLKTALDVGISLPPPFHRTYFS